MMIPVTTNTAKTNNTTTTNTTTYTYTKTKTKKKENLIEIEELQALQKVFIVEKPAPNDNNYHIRAAEILWEFLYQHQLIRLPFHKKANLTLCEKVLFLHNPSEGISNFCERNSDVVFISWVFLLTTLVKNISRRPNLGLMEIKDECDDNNDNGLSGHYWQQQQQQQQQQKQKIENFGRIYADFLNSWDRVVIIKEEKNVASSSSSGTTTTTDTDLHDADDDDDDSSTATTRDFSAKLKVCKHCHISLWTDYFQNSQICEMCFQLSHYYPPSYIE